MTILLFRPRPRPRSRPRKNNSMLMVEVLIFEYESEDEDEDDSKLHLIRLLYTLDSQQSGVIPQPGSNPKSPP